jgi:hypothetical protein
MGVLRRVCDDTPRPLREVNPDIPDWLAAIIAKLHAKSFRLHGVNRAPLSGPGVRAGRAG